MKEKLDQIIENLNARIKNIEAKKNKSDNILASLNEKTDFEDQKTKIETYIAKVKESISKIETFAVFQEKKASLEDLIKKIEQKVDDYFNEVDAQKTKEGNFPQKNYLKLAREFHGLMKNRYSFWGDGDSWEEFDLFFQTNIK